MPEWNFFAFNAKRVASAILIPAQEAIRNRDLPAWQKVYDKLNSCHFPPHQSGFAWGGTIIENFATARALSRDQVPEESSAGVRKSLQTFVELVSQHHLESRRTRVRTWVMNVLRWENILTSEEELTEMELFKTEVIAAGRHLPDPFWCLSSNDVCDSNYVAPETVAAVAEMEGRVGLFRNLVRRTDLDKDVKALAGDLAAAGLLIELSANRGLALYFREDGT